MSDQLGRKEREEKVKGCGKRERRTGLGGSKGERGIGEMWQVKKRKCEVKMGKDEEVEDLTKR